MLGVFDSYEDVMARNLQMLSMNWTMCVYNTIHRRTLAFSVICLLRQKLQGFVPSWKSHCIRQSKNDVTVLGGIPDDLYEMPENDGKRNKNIQYSTYY